MFFTKMSLRGKIASVIIALFLLFIIILIGKSIYWKITESVNMFNLGFYIITVGNKDIFYAGGNIKAVII